MARFWIIKHIFEIHPFYYIAAFIACMTGSFRQFLIFSMIIIVHECGHLAFAMHFKWNIEKVLLLPFGGVTIFNEDINRPLYEEFIILIMGPIFQIILTFFIKDKDYSLTILLFNLLPIYPLDGSKLVGIILNKITSFKRSHLITLYISFLTILIVLIKHNFDLVFLLILSFIIYRVLYEVKNHNYIFNKFLLERHLKNYKFKKQKIIKREKDMKRDYLHFFKIKNRYITEGEYLKKRFDFKGKT